MGDEWEDQMDRITEHWRMMQRHEAELREFCNRSKDPEAAQEFQPTKKLEVKINKEGTVAYVDEDEAIKSSYQTYLFLKGLGERQDSNPLGRNTPEGNAAQLLATLVEDIDVGIYHGTKPNPDWSTLNKARKYIEAANSQDNENYSPQEGRSLSTLASTTNAALEPVCKCGVVLGDHYCPDMTNNGVFEAANSQDANQSDQD